MLKLTKETLTDLTDGQMAAVVGGYAITGPQLTIRTIEINPPADSCVAASCITNG